jgi:hypothetical protein
MARSFSSQTMNSGCYSNYSLSSIWTNYMEASEVHQLGTNMAAGYRLMHGNKL